MDDEDDTIQLAGCLITDDYGRLLLLHRSTDQVTHWELPGGKIEGDETPAHAATRELREELGMAVDLTESFGSHTFEHNDAAYTFHWFGARIIHGKPQLMEPELFDDYDYVDVEDLPSLALSANMLVLEEKLLSGEISL